MLDIFNKYGGKPNGQQIRMRCPFCTKSSLDISLGEKQLLVAYCLECRDKREGHHILKQLGLPVGVLSDEQRADFVTAVGGLSSHSPPANRCEIKLRHELYTTWLDACELDEKGKDFLCNYGLLFNDVVTWGYVSWPNNPYYDLDEVATEEDLLTVPGVIKMGGKLTVALNDPKFAGVVVPVRDVEGRIAALKLRLYEADVQGKMRSFSSAAFGGPEAEYCVHHPIGTKPSEKVYVVEGELKADVIASRTGLCVIGVPGVRGINDGLLNSLKKLGAKHVVCMLDQDQAGKRATLETLFPLLADDYTLWYADWPSTHKGPDDLVKDGLKWCEHPADWAMENVLAPSISPTALLEPRIKRRSAEVIRATDFPEPGWIVPNLIPTGLTILCAKPKVGKSMLSLDLAIAVATGTEVLDPAYVCTKGPVLYFDMEGTPRGSKKRIQNVVGDRGLHAHRLYIVNSDSNVPRMPAFVEALNVQWQECGNPRLVIIDTWAKVKAGEEGKSSGYDNEYDQLNKLKDFADQSQIGIILIHHLRKNLKDVDDLFDGILGSTALSGAVDTLGLLVRNRNEEQGKLAFAGREVEHTEVDVRFDKESHRWRKCHPKDKPKRLTAEVWLTGFLSDGMPRHREEVITEGAKVGFSVESIDKASSKLEVIRSGGHRGSKAVWKLNLPDQEAVSRLEDKLTELDAQLRKSIDQEDYESSSRIKADIERVQAELDKRKESR